MQRDQQLARQGEDLFNQMDKVNSELVALTYGAIVTQLLKDYKDVDTVNTELEKMGYNIGVRLIEEFLAKSNTQSCNSFKETGFTVAKVAFKMFLGIPCDVNVREDQKEFSLLFKGSPLNEFVQLPPQYTSLHYGNIICGVIRGALNMIRLVVTCQYVKCELRGGDYNEIKVTLKDIQQESYKDDDE
mmetsp:Transcript_43548/g.85259  ORF Transcript_43548/g.85259 Transcript_43548/m.85259 type:complete len:187 (+) Transcript_43548:32-592(+)